MKSFRSTAVLKKKTIPASPERELSRLVERYSEVQLATLVVSVPGGDDWVHEIKYDGYRLLGFVSNGEARLRTRNGNDWTSSFPAIASGLKKVKAASAVLDMEAAVPDAA